MLTKRAKYAINALILLAKETSGELIRIETIAQKGHIPRKFLEGILLELKNGGILHSKKGKGGGYHLAITAETISIGDVIRLIDGPLAPVTCVSRTAYAPCDDCPDVKTCGIRMVMRRAHEASIAILDSSYLSDVIEYMTDSTTTSADALMYYI